MERFPVNWPLVRLHKLGKTALSLSDYWKGVTEKAIFELQSGRDLAHIRVGNGVCLPLSGKTALAILGLITPTEKFNR